MGLLNNADGSDTLFCLDTQHNLLILLFGIPRKLTLYCRNVSTVVTICILVSRAARRLLTSHVYINCTVVYISGKSHNYVSVSMENGIYIQLKATLYRRKQHKCIDYVTYQL